MELEEYRKNVVIAFDRAKEPESRVAAIEALTGHVAEEDDLFSGLLRTLGDPAEHPSVRSAVIAAIQAEMFSRRAARARRPFWLATLRTLVEDPDVHLRLRAIGILSREKDGLTQHVLLRGLREPAKAVVPPEQALHFLANDIHAEVYAAARAIAAAPPSADARLAALRILAADGESALLFEEVARDREEPAAARRLALVALASLAPVALREHAFAILWTDDEDPDVLATTLAALALHRVPLPPDLEQRVGMLRFAANPGVRGAAERLYAQRGSSLP